MDDHYEAFLQTGIDLSPFGWERCDGFEPYFCTPCEARVLGCAGVDGIHYCTIPDFGDMIFAVSPMNFGDCVHPIARDFRELLRLLLAGADLAALEQCYAWDEAQYRAFLQDEPETAEQRAARAAIREALGLSPVEDAFRTVKDLQRTFDLSRIPYTAEYYETTGEPVPAEAAPWRVSFSGGFWSDEDGGGETLPIGRRFSWDGRDWLIPAVYVFPEGIVMDFCAEAEPADIRAFLDRWGLWQGEPDELSEAQREAMERENPLQVDFDAELLWNGAVLQQTSGCGVCWFPADCRVEGTENDRSAAALLAHYGLDESQGWALHRRSFPFPEDAERVPRTLALRLMAEARAFSGESFTVSAPGQSVALTHPRTGERFTLTVTAFEPETLPASAFPDPARECPTVLVTMRYVLMPEPTGGFQLRDCAPADPPRRRAAASPQGGSAAIGIIGGADGPVAVFAAPKGAAGRGACSSLHFAPPKQVTWRPVFREKTVEDMTVTLR